MTNQTEIVAALRTLGVTSQKLFELIRADLERGLVDEALAQLAFVDELVAAGGETELSAEKEAHEFTATAYGMMRAERDALEAKVTELADQLQYWRPHAIESEAKIAALRWTHDKPTKPGLYLLADAPNTNPTPVSVRQATDGKLVLVDEPDGCDSLDQLDDLHECHLWCGPVPVPSAISSSDGTSTV